MAESDFIATLFERQFHYTLEKIILPLPKESLLICKAVSSVWNEIVSHYLNSNIPRITRILDSRLSREWKTKNPQIKIRTISNEDYIGHMIADQKNIVLASWIQQPKIFLIDSTSLNVLQVFDLKTYEDFPIFQFKVEIKLAMSEAYLVAFMYASTSDDTKTGICYIWNRKNNFNLHQIKCIIKKDKKRLWKKPLLQGFQVIYVPFVHRDIVYLPMEVNNKAPYCYKVINKEIRINNFRQTSEIVETIPNHFVKGQHFDFSGEMMSISRQFGLCHNDEDFKFVWSKEKKKTPIVVGVDKDYIAIMWSTPMPKEYNELEVYQLSDGVLEIQVCLKLRHGQTIHPDTAVQINHGRMALFGKLLSDPNPEYDLTVYDLQTGEFILSLRRDLNIQCERNFVLGKDRVLGTHLGKIFSVEFCV